jgi:hypothetical protein
MDTNRPTSDVQAPCRHLLSKGMFIAGKRILDEAGEVGDGHCWCNMTQNYLGPDSKPVDRLACSSGRTCYVAIL